MKKIGQNALKKAGQNVSRKVAQNALKEAGRNLSKKTGQNILKSVGRNTRKKACKNILKKVNKINVNKEDTNIKKNNILSKQRRNNHREVTGDSSRIDKKYTRKTKKSIYNSKSERYEDYPRKEEHSPIKRISNSKSKILKMVNERNYKNDSEDHKQKNRHGNKNVSIIYNIYIYIYII